MWKNNTGNGKQWLGNRKNITCRKSEFRVYLKLVPAIFIKFLFFHQIIAPQKL